MLLLKCSVENAEWKKQCYSEKGSRHSPSRSNTFFFPFGFYCLFFPNFEVLSFAMEGNTGKQPMLKNENLNSMFLSKLFKHPIIIFCSLAYLHIHWIGKQRKNRIKLFLHFIPWNVILLKQTHLRLSLLKLRSDSAVDVNRYCWENNSQPSINSFSVPSFQRDSFTHEHLDLWMCTLFCGWDILERLSLKGKGSLDYVHDSVCSSNHPYPFWAIMPLRQ